MPKQRRDKLKSGNECDGTWGEGNEAGSVVVVVVVVVLLLMMMKHVDRKI